MSLNTLLIKYISFHYPKLTEVFSKLKQKKEVSIWSFSCLPFKVAYAETYKYKCILTENRKWKVRDLFKLTGHLAEDCIRMSERKD